MKKILITGANSYVGTSFENWVAHWPEKYYVDTVETRNGEWKEKDFSQYDVVFHVAGIAHVKETEKNENLYYKVNRDLAYEIAKRTKAHGVKQFIFLSSMSVYGVENGVINKNTSIKPNSAYGKSKIEAEKLISKLSENSFNVAILRPPMVYGKDCKGNYPKLARLARNSPVFPKVDNKRSMIYIDNLSEFVKQLIDNCSKGLFFPQNAEYVNTSEMVKVIAEIHKKTLLMTEAFNPLLDTLNVRVLNKVFGDLVYEISMSDYETDYRLFSFKQSIKQTELKD